MQNGRIQPQLADYFPWHYGEVIRAHGGTALLVEVDEHPAKSDAKRVDCRLSCWAFLELISKKRMPEAYDVAQPTVKLELQDDAQTLTDVVAGFLQSVSSSKAFAVDIPLPSVGSSSSHLDLSDDFLDASLIAERIGPLATRRSMSWSKVQHLNVIRLELDGYQPQTMALELARMAIFLDYPNLETEGLCDEYERVWDARRDYEDSMEQTELLFPEIADHYIGNLVMSFGEWEDPEALREHFQRHPERRYGFFVTRSISAGGRAVLSSDGELILPADAPLGEVLESVGYGGEALVPARMVMTEQEASFIGDHIVVDLPSELVTQAMACGDEFVRRTQSDPDSYDLVAFRGRVAGADGELSALVGDLSGFAALRCFGFTIVFFTADQRPTAGRAARAGVLQSLATSLHDGGSAKPTPDLPWELLDDELFEQLCWDYLYASPQFDRDRLEKIGKSNSRDGGRDIVTWTNRAPPFYRAPVKWIFQCKHIRADESLTPRHIKSIGDVIDQYGASGYGVMTCGYIDATLHDRVDSICARRGAEARKIDRFLLQTFVSARPHLVERYFRARGVAKA